ncbi:hypothetical protein WMY93_033936 [Mugilogobius chulae]|uniref:Uncharacterized protein n=1 Tax=Mugilogobius chulae TaxID=88201 RepID=A0AAW0MRE2_9GOBI
MSLCVCWKSWCLEEKKGCWRRSTRRRRILRLRWDWTRAVTTKKSPAAMMKMKKSDWKKPPIKRAAWVDEDDETEEQVDVTHRFRRDFVKGGEASLSKSGLQQRMRERSEVTQGSGVT